MQQQDSATQLIWNGTSQEEETASFDFLGMMWRRKLLIVLGILTGIGLGYLYYTRAEVVYEAEGQVTISPKSAVGMNENQSGSFYGETREFTGHHKIMMSPVFLARVAREYKFSKLETFKGLKNDQIALRILKEEHLLATPDKGNSHIYKLVCRGPVKDELPNMVQSILDAYRKTLDEKYKQGSEGAVEQVKADLEEVSIKYKQEVTGYEAFQTASRLDYREGVPYNEHLVSAIDYAKRQRQSEAERDEVGVELDWLKNAAMKESNHAALLYIIGQFETRDSKRVATAREELSFELEELPPLVIKGKDSPEVFKLILELEELRQKFGDGHRDIVSLKSKIEEWSRYYDSLNEQKMQRFEEELALKKKIRNEIKTLEKEELTKTVGPDGTVKTNMFEIDYIKIYRVALEKRKEKLDTESALWKEKYNEARALGDTLRGEFQRDRRMQQRIADLQARKDRISSEYYRLFEGHDRGGFHFTEMAVGNNPEQAEPNLLMVMALSVFLGGLAGFGLGYLVDIADKTFRTPDEISNALGIPLIGHIPVLLTNKKQKLVEGSQIDETVSAFHRPRSQMAEAFRAVRTSLYFSTQGKSHRIIQVTSPTPGDGKSTLAANLAVSIAQSGKRVLLIDADLRRPSAHFLMGVDGEVGFAQVLSGTVHPHEATYDTEVDGLSFMPCGAKPSNPSELLTSQCLDDSFQVLRQEYDFVIVDTPPMLAVTDPGPVAARADGVILAIRIKKNVKLSAERARDMLKAINANVLGIVVNGVGANNSYYHGYNSGYTPGYAYQYEIGYGDGKKYYDDDAEDVNEFVAVSDAQQEE